MYIKLSTYINSRFSININIPLNNHASKEKNPVKNLSSYICNATLRFETAKCQPNIGPLNMQSIIDCMKTNYV